MTLLFSAQSTRFRSRVVQVTYSTPGIKAPDKEIDDDALIEQLKKVIDERTDLKRQVQDGKENLHVANSTKREILENSKKLKQQLNEAVVSVHFEDEPKKKKSSSKRPDQD